MMQGENSVKSLFMNKDREEGLHTVYTKAYLSFVLFLEVSVEGPEHDTE